MQAVLTVHGSALHWGDHFQFSKPVLIKTGNPFIFYTGEFPENTCIDDKYTMYGKPFNSPTLHPPICNIVLYDLYAIVLNYWRVKRDPTGGLVENSVLVTWRAKVRQRKKHATKTSYNSVLALKYTE